MLNARQRLVHAAFKIAATDHLEWGDAEAEAWRRCRKLRRDYVGTLAAFPRKFTEEEHAIEAYELAYHALEITDVREMAWIDEIVDGWVWGLGGTSREKIISDAYSEMGTKRHLADPDRDAREKSRRVILAKAEKLLEKRGPHTTARLLQLDPIVRQDVSAWRGTPYSLSYFKKLIAEQRNSTPSR
jgi:hypothetical protein